MTTAKQYDYLNRLTGIASYSTGFQPVKFRTPTTQRTGGFGPNSRCGRLDKTTMKRPTSLPRRWILAALALAAPAVSAQAGPILYAFQDPRIAEVRQGVAPGSQENQRIERAFVGDWIYRHEIAQATVGFRWTSVRIQAEGTLVLEYSVR